MHTHTHLQDLGCRGTRGREGVREGALAMKHRTFEVRIMKFIVALKGKVLRSPRLFLKERRNAPPGSETPFSLTTA